MTQMFGNNNPEIDAVATGKRIKALRKELGLKVTDISDYMGFLEPQAVYKWMSGKSLPTLQNMLHLSLLFGTTIEDIIRLTGQEECGQERPVRRTKERGDDERSSPGREAA